MVSAEEFEPAALSLILDSNRRIYNAGGTIEGEVLLYIPKVLEMHITGCNITLRGSVRTSITRHIIKRTTHHVNTPLIHHGNTPLIHESITLWRKKEYVYYSDGLRWIVLPFKFVLPLDLPPSYHGSGADWEGTVGYSLEVVAECEDGRYDVRERKAFLVLPIDWEGTHVWVKFRGFDWAGKPYHWESGWRPYEQVKWIRPPLWGDRSCVAVTLFIPDIGADAVDMFPTSIAIPFHLNVITMSKIMEKDAAGEGDTISPLLPSLHKHVQFQLKQNVAIKAQDHTTSVSDHFVTDLGGIAPGQDDAYYKDVQVLPFEKVWMPCTDPRQAKKNKGRWMQRVAFRSSIKLTCPPTFKTDLLSVEYYAIVSIDLRGAGSNLELKIPMQILSSAPPPERGYEGMVPLELEVPSAYFDKVGRQGWHDGAA